MKKINCLLSVAVLSVLSVLSVGPVQGADMTGKLGMALHGGIYKLGLTDHSDIWTVGRAASVGMKYWLSSKFVIGLEGQAMQTYLADLNTASKQEKGAGFTFDNVPDGPRQRSYIIGAVAEYHFMPEKNWTPYIFGGPGIYIWQWADKNWKTLSSQDPALAGTGIPPTDKAGNWYNLKDQELYFMGGVGIEFFPAEWLSLELGGKARYLSHLLTNFKDDQDIVGKNPGQLDLPQAIGEVYAGLTFYFGGKVKDQDQDGVPDKKDKCPDTPVGCQVDATGCPIDSDGDGVCDGIDQCPNTPKGCKVDAKGCPTDSDGDGICDGIDQCPNTPKGCKVDAKGCPTDSDGDGICDVIDQCPNTPKGCEVDAKGCPTDSDGDGVCNGVDRCPDTPSGVKVDNVGCPISEFIPEPEKPVVLHGVHFEFNKSILTADSKTILNAVATSLIARPDVKVEIAGHTDWIGSDAYNLKLSNARADAVMQYLISKGVKADNLTAMGYGETQPIADNNTDEGRTKNRRVELRRIQ